MIACSEPAPPAGEAADGRGGATGGTVSTMGGSAGSAPEAGAAGVGGSATGGAAGQGGAAGAGGGTGGSLPGGASGSAGAAAGAAGDTLGGAAGSGGNAGAGAGAGGAAGAGGSGGGTSDPGTEGDGDHVISPPYTNAPELTVGNGVPRGTRERFTLPSSESAIYPTDVASGQPFNRQVEVYIPNGYQTGTAAPLMIVQDGSSYVGRLAPVLDNMIADGRLPKLVAVFVNPGPGDGPGSQRGLEYDTVSDVYTNFVETELLPKIAADYQLTFTTDPEGRSSFGCSSGGAAAFTMGWFRPDLYRRIVTYSGTFTNQAPNPPSYPHGAWEYHENLIPNNDPKPLRVFLEVGENDNGSTSPASGYRNWVLANQGMARELLAKGYHYRFVFAEGAGHCASNVIGQTLPETLLWAFRGYPI